MNDIFRDMIEIKNLFHRIFNKDIRINIYTPLPMDNDNNFDLNILCGLKSNFKSKINFRSYKYLDNVNMNIFINYEKSNISKIKINKEQLFSKKLISITFFYKNKENLINMYSLYNNSMNCFFNPLEINLKK